MEQDKISEWTWWLVRRSTELLKQCAVADSVKLPPLSPWLPSLNRPKQNIQSSDPSPKQLTDAEDIYTLVWKCNREMSNLGLTETTLRHYREEGLSIILKWHYEEGTERYSDEILVQLVSNKRAKYEQGQISRTSYQNLRKAANWVQQIHLTGAIAQGKLPNWNQQQPTESLNVLLQRFCAEIKRYRSMAETSFNVAKSAIRRFLLEMQGHGFNSLGDFSQKNINCCITSFALHYNGGLNTAIYCVRVFLQFLFESELTDVDLSKSLPELTATRKMFHESFSSNELECLLGHPDRTTALGKRDYAMMLLAAQSGLRACDIVRLEMHNIDWRTREISLVQHKTNQPLSLPLEPEIGNAIADYILNGRPNSTIPNIFLCHTGASRPLDARSASGVVSKRSLWRGNVSASTICAELSYLKLLDSLQKNGLHFYYWKMSLGCYRMTRAGRLIPSSPCLLKWGIISNGVCITANISESRNSADGCILSDILTEEAPEKYFLSAAAMRKLLDNLSAARKANVYMVRTE